MAAMLKIFVILIACAMHLLPTVICENDAIFKRMRRSENRWPMRSLSKTRRHRRAACDSDLVEPLVIFPHQHVELECSKCPGSSQRVSSATWRFQPATATNDEQITRKLKLIYDLKIEEDGSNRLIIKQASKDNKGRYYCKSGANYLGNYDVAYASHPEFHLVVAGDEEYSPLPETRNNATNEVIMYTEWGSWSSCNQCGKPGERVKMGICYARTRLDEFRGGVPCRSNAVPYKERSKYSYDKRKDEKMIGTCKVKCPPKPRETGKKAIVKTFALSAGVPTLPKLVKRRVYYEDVGSNAELVCPEAGVTHGVRWMNGSKTLSQMEFMKANSRFRIDHLNRLYIENVQFYDSRNYTCWFENKQVAVVIIKVVEAPSIDEDMEGNAMYVGMVLVFLVAFYIVLGVCKNRKLQTIQ